MRPGRSNTRRGMTLVELATSLTIMTIVLGLCVALITMLIKLTESSHRHASDEAAVMRASRLFREDARNAREVVSKSGGKRLWLGSAPGFSVEYSASGEGLVRVAWWHDEVVKEERLPLPAKSSPRFEVHRENGREIAALLLDRRRPTADEPAKPRVLRIEGAAGASGRFASNGGGSR